MDFRKVLKEIDAIRNSIILFMCFLDACVLFLGLYLFFFLITLYPTYIAGIFSFFYFLSKSFKEVNSKKLVDVEKRHPILWERLRTAADSVDSQNFMVLRLRASIIQNLRAIFDMKKIMKRLGILVGFSLVILVVSVYGIHIIDMENIIKTTDWRTTLRDKLLRGHIPDALLGRGDVNDFLEIEDINDQMNKRERFDEDAFSAGLPSDLFQSADTTFEETMSKKKRIYIRNYFSKIRNLE